MRDLEFYDLVPGGLSAYLREAQAERAAGRRTWVIESVPSATGHFYELWMSAAPAGKAVEWSNQQDITRWSTDDGGSSD